MKLKILPPTLRINKRYIVFELISQKKINRSELIQIIWNSCLSYYGEIETSNFRLWLMRILDFEHMGEDYITKGILQCDRNYVEKVRVALSLANNFDNKKIVFHILGVSGTIKSANKKFIN